ncbi:hypothetical protein A2U01_0031841, partial [Trifolium medium]|nr:hypothetical protein [Trifolium medium]
NPIHVFLTIGPTCRIRERVPALLEMDELSAKMGENLVTIDKFLNTLTETKEIVLELRGKRKLAVAAKGSAILKFIAEEGGEAANNCEDGGLKSKNLEPSLLEADKETHQEVPVFLEMEASQTVNLPTFTGIDPPLGGLQQGGCSWFG